MSPTDYRTYYIKLKQPVIEIHSFNSHLDLSLLILVQSLTNMLLAPPGHIMNYKYRMFIVLHAFEHAMMILHFALYLFLAWQFHTAEMKFPLACFASQAPYQ